MTEVSIPSRGPIPMTNPSIASWDIPISSTDHSKLLNGFRPQSMDDKWELIADGLDAHGNFVLHMYRSWTRQEQLALTVQPNKISQIQWLPRQDFGEDDAKKFVRAICRGLLACDLGDLS